MDLYHLYEEFEADDPGNALRSALNEQALTIDHHAERRLGEILYTGEERYILSCRIDVEDALTIWRMVELARSSRAQDVQNWRM